MRMCKAFRAAETVLGVGFGALLLAGGLRVAANPELRPPRLPNRRPARWVLPSVGLTWMAASISATTAAKTADHARCTRAGRSRCAGLSSPRSFPTAMLCVLALPGAAAVVFEAARQRSADLVPTVPARSVVVLGCALKSDQPSELLLRRLNRALAVCDDSTERIICCGGFGSEAVTDATRSEAAAMVDWLVSHARRVVKQDDHLAGARENNRQAIVAVAEEQSRNTAENVKHAIELLEAANPSAVRAGTVVVTSDFHVPRVAKLVREMDLAEWCVVGAYSPLRYWATSVLREFLAQFVLWLPGGSGRILRISRRRDETSR